MAGSGGKKKQAEYLAHSLCYRLSLYLPHRQSNAANLVSRNKRNARGRRQAASENKLIVRKRGMKLFGVTRVVVLVRL